MDHTNLPTILIVDDVLDGLKAMIGFLKRSGFRIETAPDGIAAIKHVKQSPPDLILMDVIMPGMDGFETCRRLKAHEAAKDIPVIFLTALASTEEKVSGFDAGGADYLTKPVQPKELLARINLHLTIRKLQQQLQEQNVRLEEQNARFQLLADMTFVGVLIHEAGRIIEVNQTIEQMFGYSREELLGRHVFDFATPASRKIIAEHLQARDETPYEAEGIKNDGSIFPVEVHVRNMTYQGREVRTTVMRDLSWQRDIEEEKAQLQRENLALRSSLKNQYKFGELIGRSPAMQEVYMQIGNAAASSANVVIYGESGSGKELVARTIHNLSPRKDHAFVAVNCGAVPEPLFEREFFGHRKGAFTGAERDRPGYFDRAHLGTLFLDEVNALSPALQTKLLRVLEERSYKPLGDTSSKHVDVRIITATNNDLRQLLRQRRIREDFFYRIYVTAIALPPLRDRKEDISLLIEHFLKLYGREEEYPTLTLPARMMERLYDYDWPGNVRELQNELQRYLAGQGLEFLGRALPCEGLPEIPAERSADPTQRSLHEAVEALEKQMIAAALEHNHWHHGKSAAMLGLPPKTLYNKIKKYGLEEQ